jgi:multiple sugar transport system substrate-binding protein
MSMEALTRRRFLQLSMTASAGAALVACAPAAAPTLQAPAQEEKPTEQAPAAEAPAAAQPVTIQYWFGWGGSFDEVLKQAIATDEFQQMLPGVTVETVPSANMEKVLASVAAGTPPDGVSNMAYPELIARGVGLDVTDWINTSTVIKKDDIFQSTWDSATMDGRIYGVPGIEGFLRWGFCYNEELVSQGGLDPAKPPLTWDEAFEFHKALSKFDDAGNVTQVGFDPIDAMGSSIGGGDPFFLPVSMGFEYYDADAKKYNLDNELFVEGLTIIQKFYDLLGAEKMRSFRQSYGTWTGPGTGICAATQVAQINGYWTPGELAVCAPEKKFSYSWPMVPTARQDKKIQCTGGHYVLIPKDAKNPEPAFHFGEFLNTDTACDIIFNGIGWLPSRISYMTRADISKYRNLDWFVNSATDTNEMHAVVNDPLTGVTYNRFVEATDAVIYGTKTPEQAAKDMQDQLTKELESFLASQ